MERASQVVHPGNWVDLGTKSLEKDRLDRLMLQMPLSRGGRRTAVVANAGLSSPSASSPNEDKGRVQETTYVVNTGAAGSATPWSDTSFAVIDTVLTGACWMVANLLVGTACVEG